MKILIHNKSALTEPRPAREAAIQPILSASWRPNVLALNSLRAAALALALLVIASTVPAQADPPADHSVPIPMDQLGVVAGKQYQGDGLSATATRDGARLRCVLQRLEGEATRDGLWLTSTVRHGVNDRFRIVAAEVERVEREASERPSVKASLHAPRSNALRLAATGTVAIDGQTVRFIRPGLVEEYTVSMDGVRQDFVITERPAGAGNLRVELALSGARAEAAAYGAKLTLAGSGRALAYSRLRVTDATGRELTAHLEVLSTDRLSVCVADANATYPLRIDPTFSDANWMSMGGIPGVTSYVYAAAVDGSGNLYIGGTFGIAGDVIANCIAKWDGSSWTAVGSRLNATVYALAVSGSDLYAGGAFTNAGGSAANYIAKWDGNSWSALGSGMGGVASPRVYALAVSGSDVYAGGYFTTAGANPATNIAKWNGTGWTALGSGMNGSVSALAVSGSNVYAGGKFTTAGGGAAASIAKWNGTGWTALGLGMGADGSPRVAALAVSGSDLYAGGYFATAGGGPASYIAKWNGSSWTGLGSGMNNTVEALAVSGGDLYAGGTFTTAGGSTANYIAKWDGNSWSALGSGMGGGTYPGVKALAVSGSDLYVGGQFTTAGGSAAKNIAKWDGSSWTALGSGMSGPPNYPYSGGSVVALAVSGSNVYAGGGFTNAGGSAANYIAKWDGSSWSALGSGVGSTVYALAVSGSNAYAGGYFTAAGGNAATNIAKWDGSSWSALGSGISGSVLALAVSGSNVYAGGQFTTAGGNAATNIAKWDGSSWAALGSGISGSVLALAVSGGDLYAGGDFTKAGGKVSGYVAHAYLPALPLLSVLGFDGNVMVSWPSVDTAGFVLEQSHTVPAPATWLANTASVSDDGTNKWVSLPATNSPQFFRLRRP
jgi:hypothetical protein